MTMANSFIIMPGTAEKVQILSPPLLQAVYPLDSCSHQQFPSLLGVYIRIIAAYLEDGLKWGSAAAFIYISYRFAPLGVAVLDVAGVLGFLALCV